MKLLFSNLLSAMAALSFVDVLVNAAGANGRELQEPFDSFGSGVSVGDGVGIVPQELLDEIARTFVVKYKNGSDALNERMNMKEEEGLLEFDMLSGNGQHKSFVPFANMEIIQVNSKNEVERWESYPFVEYVAQSKSSYVGICGSFRISVAAYSNSFLFHFYFCSHFN